MKYDLRTPCDLCPFRSDEKSIRFATGDRAREIAEGAWRGEFCCHKTGVVSDDDEKGEIRAGPKSQHCAGALIMFEKMEQPSQMMRICERLGLYDRTKLDMDAPVFDDIEEMVDANDPD